MNQILQNFEKVVVGSLVGMMMLTVLVATVELGWLIVKDLAQPPIDFLTISELLDVFGFFMMILIGIELIDSVKAYLKDHHIRVEAVIMVAMIAIARKVIILDYKETPAINLIGIAALMGALAGGYYLARRTSLDEEAAARKKAETP
jgi:uncharacterized membrane protein (DUF373 family)